MIHFINCIPVSPFAIKMTAPTLLRPNMLCACLLTGLLLTGCTTPREKHQTLEVQTVKLAPYSGPKYKIAIGHFQNKSPYMRGLFSDGEDRLGKQARQILKTHLSQAGRFSLLDRMNLNEMTREADFSKMSQQIAGAQLLISGAVTEFGRREIGGMALGGVLGGSKSQVAHAKVQLSVMNVKTSEVLASVQGAGEYKLTNEHVLGFGSRAGYDGTLADKVLNLAVIEAVNDLSAKLEQGQIAPN